MHNILEKQGYKIMKKTFRAFVAVLAAIVIGFTPAAQANAAQTDVAVAASESAKTYNATEIYEKSAPACVEIRITDSKGQIYIGSGFFVGKYNVLTNAHVIDNASRIQVFGIDGKEYTLKSIYGIDSKMDLALLRVKEKNKNYLELGEVPAVGKDVYAIGNPVGIIGTFTKGMISNALRVIDENDYVQLDIPSGMGIGGGPVIDETGKVIGVMCLTVPSANCVNLAVRADVVKKFLDGLKKKDRISLKKYYEEKKDGVITPNGINLVDNSDFKYTSNVFGRGLTEKAPDTIYDESVGALTRIVVYGNFFGSLVELGSGSGCFIGENKIITATHVVDKVKKEFIAVFDKAGNLYQVENIISSEEGKDISVLEVKLKEYAEGGEDFEHSILTINTYYVPAPGEEVYALGNPQNYSFTLSKGMVRIPRLTVMGADYVCHQAPTSEGSSGGVLLNKYGEIIAVTNMLILGVENFCISTMVKNGPEEMF